MQTPIENTSLSLVPVENTIMLPKDVIIVMSNHIRYQEQAKLARVDRAYNVFFSDNQSALAQYKDKHFYISRSLNNLLFIITKFDRTGLGPDDETNYLHVIKSDLNPVGLLMSFAETQKLFAILKEQKDEIKCLQSLLTFFQLTSSRQKCSSLFITQPAVVRKPTSERIRELIQVAIKNDGSKLLAPTDTTGIPCEHKKKPVQRRF